MASHPAASMIPGRSALKQRPADVRAGSYERSRARDAYRRQMNIFKAKLEASFREHDRLDLDAKQEIRIRAKRQRELCLRDYRESLQGLARCSQRRTYQDVFLGQLESDLEVHDTNVLEYELRLTSEMDTLIDNIRLLNADKSNLSKLDWFSNLARAKFSYEYELDQPPEPPFDDQSMASSSDYVYRPYASRHNLYGRHDDDDQQPSRTPAAAMSQEDAYDYEPFQPFQDVPMRLRRLRYPEAARDAEWASSSAVFSRHRPSPSPCRFTPSRFDLNLDSNCPTYGYGQEPMAGLDYEYQPIIPSYRLNGDEQHTDSRFKYDDGDNVDNDTSHDCPRNVHFETEE